MSQTQPDHHPPTGDLPADLAIVGARVFDGREQTRSQVVVISDGVIAAVSDDVPAGVEHVDGRGATLLPGLIDAHVHTDARAQRLALTFGVTTTLDMGTFASSDERYSWATDERSADIRAAGPPITAPAGHPTQMFPATRPDAHTPCAHDFPQVDDPLVARARVEELVASGWDFVKFILEDGALLGSPGLAELAPRVYEAGVEAAHAHRRMAVTHTMTRAGTALAARAGSDGIVHLFVDGPHSAELVETVRAAGSFVTPCLSLVASLAGRTPTGLAEDRRVTDRLSPRWRESLDGSLGTAPGISWRQVTATVRALADAGVDLLAGTDFQPGPGLVPGVVPGASLHGELQLLVDAGLSPVQALLAATATPARRFGLHDRGRIAPGLRADLLLVDGDPTNSIGDTLAIRQVWRAGRSLTAGLAPHLGSDVVPHGGR
ncbi:amidohydrolase family protein [Actinacidiphila sp. bgisy144]|uniref:amidohydrolase family protein n=1 Tax=unclassified Actinacidiphila TaxID=2995708 RepID=UPI003EB9ED8F